VRSRAKADGRSAALLAATAAAWLASTSARAEVVYDLAPSAGVGITNNARLTSTPLADEFSLLTATAQVRYLGARANHTLGYRLGWTHYFEGNGLDNLSNELSVLSALMPAANMELHLGGSAILSRVSRLAITNPSAGTTAGAAPAPAPEAQVAGTNLFIGVTATEEVIYRPNARWQLLESGNVTRITYLDSPAPPDSLLITLRGRAERIAALDTYSLESSTSATFVAGNSLISQLMAGWRREISVMWSSELQAGVMGIFRENVSPTIGPAALGSLGYRRIFWYANLTVSRLPTANLFLGTPTINNQAVLRLTLPLTRDETAVISGMAGYTFANPSNDQFTRAYDQRVAQLTVGTRFGRLPLYGTLDYSLLSQHGNPTAATHVPDLFRQVLMLNIRASFTFGPGTPPILGAPM